MTEPLLRFRGARIYQAGHAPVTVDFEADGALVLLSGDFQPFFALARGDARLEEGTALVCRSGVADAVSSGRLGLAPLLGDVPSDRTVSDVLRASASLRGFGRAEARAAADRAISEFGWSPIEKRRLETLGPGTRRSLGVACATLGRPEAIAVERPFADLGDSGVSEVERVLSVASLSRRVVVWFLRSADTDAEANLVARANAVVTLRDGIVTVRRSSVPPPVPGAVQTAQSVPDW